MVYDLHAHIVLVTKYSRGAIKTNTSREVRARQWPEVRHELWAGQFWSPSYAAIGTGGKAPLAVVKAYIENQRRPGRGPGRPAATPSLTEGARAAN